MADALRRALDALTDGEPVDWLELQTAAADLDEAARLADLQALEQMSLLLAGPGPGPPLSVVTAAGSGGSEAGSPARWGSIEIRGRLGRGAYGEVYDGWDSRLARPVALKLLPGESPASVIDEARRLARLRHPNVVTIFGADRHDGVPGLWMEQLRGRTLDEMLAAQGAFSAREASALCIDVCAAVAAIHAAGLVHRDIKAQNVMREDGGRVVLMDLGTSVDVGASDAPVATLAGTPLYMAPELFDGGTPGVATDVYALGVLLYRLVSHAFPVEARTIGEVRAAHASQRLRPLRELRADLPPRFVGVVERAMAREPTDRFASASDLERALRAVDEPGAGATRTRRAWMAVAAALAFGMLLGAVALAALRQWRESESRQSGPGQFAFPEDQYRVLSGYFDVAAAKRTEDPSAAFDALATAYPLIKSVLPDDDAIHGLTWTMRAWLRAAEGNVPVARELVEDIRWFFTQSVGEEHPYTALGSMVTARVAQLEGRFDEAAAEIARAARIRRVLLGTSRVPARGPTVADVQSLAALLQTVPVDRDTDGDGILDILELRVGLDPGRVDSDGDGIGDQDEDHDGDGVSNLLALGVASDPFLTVAHVGEYSPMRSFWQSRHVLKQGPSRDPLPGWSIATSSQGQLLQRLPGALKSRAIERGFSLFVRATPRAGWLGVTIDTSPAGPRYDLHVRRVSDVEVESRLTTDVVSRAGATDRHPWSEEAPLLLELRHVPGEGVRLYRDGWLVRSGYAGHRQFPEGIVILGVSVTPGETVDARAAYHLAWLEVR